MVSLYSHCLGEKITWATKSCPSVCHIKNSYLISIRSDPTPAELMGSHLRLACLREDALVVHGVHTVHCRASLEVGEVPHHHAGDVVLGVGQVEIVCNELALELLTEHIMII